MSYSRKRTKIDSLYHDKDAKKSVMDRAEKVLQSIPVEYPSFSKQMLPSNVSYSFWMILPINFCKFYMPNEDAKVVLVDDIGEETETTFLTKWHGLSAGWRGFAMDHRLLEGDILVFHMLSPYKLKVNIVRVYGLDVADAALILMLIHDSRNRTYNSAKDSRMRRKSEKRVKKLRQTADESESRFDDCDAEIPEGKNKKLRQTADELESRFDDCDAEIPEGKKNRTPRKSKKRVKKLGLIDDHFDRQFACNAEVPEDEESGITEYKPSNELSYCGTRLMQDHYSNSIGCR